MDVDGSSVSPSNGDIDQNLLLQFSCMNTTDKEELISQLQKVLGASVNYNTASFFLDMNSWNLQAAVGSYLDFYQPPKPSMSLKEMKTFDSAVPPGSTFEHCWHIQNSGSITWPSMCKIHQVGGESFDAVPHYVPSLPPGHSVTVTMYLTAPSSPGRHRGCFHLMSNPSEQFGDPLWVEIVVQSDNSMAIVEQMAAMPVPSSSEDSVEAGNSAKHEQISPDDQMC